MTSDSLFRETRLLFQVLKEWTEAVHPDREISVSMRAVLELLLLSGPETVPAMARRRGVSRQHIQQHVDGLLERGLVARRDNPAHKRSVLIALTASGRSLIQDMRADELDALSRLQPGVSDQAAVEQWGVITIVFRLN